MADVAKIFRINYKSDFILTLTSDAGWMTPFCIKFWTGAPSQAYYVSWDGETYNHCSFDPSEPTKLLVQFDDHHLPIGNLKFQVAYHFTVADFPNDTEDEVINPANITTEIDGETYQVMLDFTGETAPEIQFALPAYANEAQRIDNEQQRIAAETQRIANEETRIQHEESRIAAEQTRQQNEQQRINQEQARVNEYASLKADAVAATGAANDAAALANQKAQLAADKAALAQAAADLANAKALLAADKAVLAASAAQLANDKAALAQQKAEYAQTQGGYAKDQGDYAKDKGDICSADHLVAVADHGIAVDDHTQAGNDHTRAESDHGIAVDDHTQAGNDHTRAESDHGIAADDHTQAGTDHQTAAADHQTATADHTQAGNDHTRAESDHTRAESDHAAVEVYVDSLGAFDISAYHATGGVLAKYADLTAALDTNGANVPDALRKGGMSVKFVQSSDNKYVQFRYMGTAVTGNPNPFIDTNNWSLCGDEVLVENPEFIYVYRDADGKMLWAIKADGNISYGVGCPPQVQEYVLSHKKEILAEIETKVDKVDGKGLIQSEVSDSLSMMDSQEFLEIKTDNEGKILESITSDGRKNIKTPIDIPSASIESVDNSEWIYANVVGGRVLEGLKSNGVKYLAFPTNQDDIIKKDVDKIKEETSTFPTFVTTQEFNQIDGDKCSMNPYYLFTNSILINHGKVSKDLTGRDYYAKVGLFGDPHVDYDITGQVITVPPVDDRFELAVNHLNSQNIDFGFSIGDNITIETYPLREEYKKIYYRTIRNAEYPIFSIVGNHDRTVHDFTERGIIEINNIRIICFNAEFVIVQSAGHTSRGDVTDATMEWLTNAVRDSHEKGFIIILACHYPLAHVDTPTATFEESIRRHRDDIISLCQQYDVKLYIGGHEHGPNLEYMIVSDDDITLDMMNVQLGLSYIAFSTLTIDETGFHFISFDSVTGEQLHTLYVPFDNQASGTIYE